MMYMVWRRVGRWCRESGGVESDIEDGIWWCGIKKSGCDDVYGVV
jgi:hypothetical protein